VKRLLVVSRADIFNIETFLFTKKYKQGTKSGDPVECESIDNIFSANREKPLLIGSVKSNIGHSEVAAGFCSVIKSIFALESGKIAPNINFTKAKHGSEPLEAGRLRVVTETEDLEGSLIAVNSFGIGGTNGKLKYYKRIVNS
jgi:fatty acid synthase